MPSATQLTAAAPLLLAASITIVMAPIGEKLVKFRLGVDNRDAAVYALDLYSVTTLGFVIAVSGFIFTAHAGSNFVVVGIIYLLAFVINLGAIVWVVASDDYSEYVTDRRWFKWSYATLLTVGMMVVAAIVTGLLS